MSRRKKHRFEHNIQASNVIERGKYLYTTIKGKWSEVYFKNDNPIVLELACGKGEYSVGLGEVYPDKNFIGIDIKGDRIARGSKRAIEKGLVNVCFLRAGIQFLEEFFIDGEVDEIWLINPDPQPRDKEEKRRLTNEKYLSLYSKVLKLDGQLNFKTDNDFLYKYTLKTLRNYVDFEVTNYTEDLYLSELYSEHHGIKTHYEELFVEQGHIISYIKSKKVK
jgi:tRNA (guanine-N7-)-methyltransferase